MLRNVILGIIWYSEFTNSELMRFSCTPELCKICDFSGETFKGFAVLQFSMSATTTQLLSSGEFCKFCYDTILVKSASSNTSFYTNNSKMPNFELWNTCHKWAIYIYFIHNILIKTIKNGTFKQFVDTTALVHTFIGNGNTLINSQASSERFWSLFFSHVSNMSCHQQMATFHFITVYMHNNK